MSLTGQSKITNSKYDAKYRISKATEASYVEQHSLVKQLNCKIFCKIIELLKRTRQTTRKSCVNFYKAFKLRIKSLFFIRDGGKFSGNKRNHCEKARFHSNQGQGSWDRLGPPSSGVRLRPNAPLRRT